MNRKGLIGVAKWGIGTVLMLVVFFAVYILPVTGASASVDNVTASSDSVSTKLYLQENDNLSKDEPTFGGQISINFRLGSSAEWFYTLDEDIDGNYYEVYILMYAYETTCDLEIIHEKQSGGETVLASWTGISTSESGYYQWKSLNTNSGINPDASSGDNITLRITSANSDEWVSVRFGGASVKSYIKIPPPPSSLSGDVDGNCVVNIFDLAAVGLAYGSQPGDENWNSDADVHPIDGDGKINIFDLATVGLNYGSTC